LTKKEKNMAIKVIHNKKGEKEGVFIPFWQWKKIREKYKELKNIETENLDPEKEELLEELKEAVEEMKQIRTGKKEARDAEDFLNEL